MVDKVSNVHKKRCNRKSPARKAKILVANFSEGQDNFGQMTRKHSPLFVTKDLLENRYKGAEVIFLAGSVMRGEATDFSDIDVVVVYPKIDKAFRESFYHLDWPVE